MRQMELGPFVSRFSIQRERFFATCMFSFSSSLPSVVCRVFVFQGFPPGLLLLASAAVVLVLSKSSLAFVISETSALEIANRCTSGAAPPSHQEAWLSAGVERIARVISLSPEKGDAEASLPR
ncbi:uncharacterized protein BJX67DRAFT_365997 [Aspergillus lucknowensis]|uniref:Transmembrane protein n=1 Tax=Aspergillus lucknowensis TaxID=176173 RepID=A0ABR4LDY4_9EURO